jgi:hypothetical protein
MNSEYYVQLLGRVNLLEFAFGLTYNDLQALAEERGCMSKVVRWGSKDQRGRSIYTCTVF